VIAVGVLKTLIVQERKVIVEDREEWMDVTMAAKTLRVVILYYSIDASKEETLSYDKV